MAGGVKAITGNNGWAIGSDQEHTDPYQQDEADARSLYDTLENEIIPLYYQNRGCPMDADRLDRAHQGMHPHSGTAVLNPADAERICY